MVLGAAKAPKIEQSLRSAVEHHAHPVEQIDDRGRRLAHSLYWRLMGQKVTAVDRVVEMNPGRVALALGVDRAVDAALGADRMGSLDRHDREKVNLLPRLSQLDCGRQPSEAAANHDVTSGHLPSFRSRPGLE